MKATEYYSEDDSEMADVIIEAQSKLYQDMMIILNDKDFDISPSAIDDAVKELCRVTLE